jgi:hypothetical protein
MTEAINWVRSYRKREKQNEREVFCAHVLEDAIGLVPCDEGFFYITL